MNKEALERDIQKLEETYGSEIIGRKIEAIVDTRTLPDLEDYIYIELHEPYDRNKTYPPNTHISYSFKHKAIMTATRIKKGEKIPDNITKLNTEVCIQEDWVDNIESEWLTLSLDESYDLLQSYITQRLDHTTQ
jgi:hypothetical protein